jgi:hypothetical protein
MDVFVSYTLRDDILNPGKLRLMELEVARWGNPYIDLLHNRSADPQRYVIEMLNRASILLACITPKFWESEWVRLELSIARQRRIPIIAFSLLPSQEVNHYQLLGVRICTLTMLPGAAGKRLTYITGA